MSSTTPGGGFQALWEPQGAATQPAWEDRVRTGALQARNMSGFQPTLFRYTDPGFKSHIFPKAKDSFITLLIKLSLQKHIVASNNCY